MNTVEKMIYEVKPDKPDKIYRGKRQVKTYIKDLGSDWSAGGEFEEFTFDFYGNTIAVRYAGGGVAAYRPECDNRPNGGKNECENVDLSKAEGRWNSFLMRVEGYNRGADEDRNYEDALLPNWLQDSLSGPAGPGALRIPIPVLP